jgi:predicted TIM-barrel fold metal-dependent hydrolase
VPGPGSNAQAIANLDVEPETLEKIFYKNALRVYERIGAGKLTTIDID